MQMELFSAPVASRSPLASTAMHVKGEPPLLLNNLWALLAKFGPSNLEQSQSCNRRIECFGCDQMGGLKQALRVHSIQTSFELASLKKILTPPIKKIRDSAFWSRLCLFKVWYHRMRYTPAPCSSSQVLAPKWDMADETDLPWHIRRRRRWQRPSFPEFWRAWWCCPVGESNSNINLFKENSCHFKDNGESIMWHIFSGPITYRPKMGIVKTRQLRVRLKIFLLS